MPNLGRFTVSINNNEIVQNSKLKPKNFLILCTLNEKFCGKLQKSHSSKSVCYHLNSKKMAMTKVIKTQRSNVDLKLFVSSKYFNSIAFPKILLSLFEKTVCNLESEKNHFRPLSHCAVFECERFILQRIFIYLHIRRLPVYYVHT